MVALLGLRPRATRITEAELSARIEKLLKP